MSTVAGGDIVYAADNNDHETRIAAIEGRRVTTIATSAATATSGTTESAIDQVTKTLVSGKRYEIKWVLQWSGTVTDDVFFVLIRSGSGTGGTQLAFRSCAIGRQFGMTLSVEFTAGSSGSQTFTGCLRRSTGSGTMTAAGAATQPRSFSVELIS
jgi:hypothetical protein